MKRLFFIFSFLYICHSVSAQFGVSYQISNNNSKIGLSYDFSKKWWVNTGFYDGVILDDFTFDATIMYNFIHKERHDVYVGVGGIFNRFDGVIAPIGVSFKPVKDFQNLSIHIEASPIYEFNFENVIFFCGFGIRYKFF